MPEKSKHCFIESSRQSSQNRERKMSLGKPSFSRRPSMYTHQRVVSSPKSSAQYALSLVEILFLDAGSHFLSFILASSLAQIRICLRKRHGKHQRGRSGAIKTLRAYSHADFVVFASVWIRRVHGKNSFLIHPKMLPVLFTCWDSI